MGCGHVLTDSDAVSCPAGCQSFGESHGHVNLQEYNALMDVTCITRKRNAISLMYSHEAFKLLVPALQRVLKDPLDLDARGRMLLGAAFLIIADIPGRVLDKPAETPIGVVTAFLGAPFFLLILRTRQAQK